MSDSKQIKSELNSILAREVIIGSLDFQQERQSLISRVRAFKEKYNMEKLPVPKRQRGLSAFIKRLDKLSSTIDYTQDDDEDFKTSITTYLDASEGAGGKVEETVEVKQEDDPEEEKEEVKEDKK